MIPWLHYAARFPWDDFIGLYCTQLYNFSYGASFINMQVAIEALMLKDLMNISELDIIIVIQENIFIQHFYVFVSFVYNVPFNESLFVVRSESVRE